MQLLPYQKHGSFRSSRSPTLVRKTGKSLVCGAILLLCIMGAAQPQESAPTVNGNTADPGLGLRGILERAPATATLALAASSTGGLDQLCTVLTRGTGAFGLDLKMSVRNFAERIAHLAALPAVNTLQESALALGLRPEAPIGVYVDLEPTARLARISLDSNAHGRKSEPQADEANPADERLAEHWARIGLPAMVVAVDCADPERAEQKLQLALVDGGMFREPPASREIPLGDLLIRGFGDEFYYCCDGSRIYAANHLPLLRQTLECRATRATVRYGTEACPSDPHDVLAALVRIDQLAAMLPDVSPVIDLAIEGMPEIQTRLQGFLRDTASRSSGEDPMVCTLTCSDNHLGVRARTDLRRHPNLTETLGEVRQLRFGERLPADTRLLAAFRFSDRDKEQALEWIRSLPQEVQRQPGIRLVEQAVLAVGDELDLGVLESPSGPALYAVMSLAQRARAEAWMTGIAPLVPIQDSDAATTVFRWDAVPPVPVLVAFSGSACAIAAGDEEGGERLIQLLQPETRGGVYPSLYAGIGPTTPLLCIVVLEPGFLADLSRASWMPDGNPWTGESGWLGPLASVVKKIQIARCVENQWLDASLVLELSEPPGPEAP